MKFCLILLSLLFSVSQAPAEVVNYKLQWKNPASRTVPYAVEIQFLSVDAGAQCDAECKERIDHEPLRLKIRDMKHWTKHSVARGQSIRLNTDEIRFVPSTLSFNIAEPMDFNWKVNLKIRVISQSGEILDNIPAFQKRLTNWSMLVLDSSESN